MTLVTFGFGGGGAICTFGYGDEEGGPVPPPPVPYVTPVTPVMGGSGGFTVEDIWHFELGDRVPEFWTEPTSASKTPSPHYWLESKRPDDIQALLQDDDLIASIRREVHKLRLDRELLDDEREEIDMLRESVTEEQKKIEQLRADLERDRLRMLEDSAIAMEEKKVVYPPYVMYHGGVPLLGVIPNYEPAPVVPSGLLNDYIVPFGKGIMYGAIAGFFIVLLLKLAKDDKKPAA